MTRPPSTRTAAKPRWRPHLGLLGRTVLALAAVGLIPLAMAVLPLIRMNVRALEDQVLKTHALAADTAANAITNTLRAASAVGATAAGSPAVLTDPTSEVARQIFQGLLETHPEIGAFEIRNSFGQLVIRAQQPGLGTSMAPILEAVSDPKAGTANLFEVEGGQRWVRIEEDLTAADGKIILALDGSLLDDILQPFQLGDEAQLGLGIGDRLVTAPNADRSSFPQQALELARTGRVQGAGRFVIDDEGQDVLSAYSAIGDLPWFVISTQPAAIAEATSHRMQRRALTAVGLALLLTSLLALGAWLSVVKPLRRVVQTQRRLAGGTGQAPAGSGNELKALQQSLDALEERLRDQRELGEVFLDRYRVQEVLGKGAMGTVFRGWDPKLERPVALKTVRLGDSLAEDERKRLGDRLMREAVTAARFSHPNIVAVYDVAEAADATYFAMEYVDGITLEQLLRRHRLLTQELTVPLGEAVARALDAAHRNGIIHHDVKPSNVLLGYDGAIKVVDFGIAEPVSGPVDASERLFGTPGYLPPECLLGQGYDERGDLFALGVILHECLTGRRLFSGRTLKDVFHKTVNENVIPHRIATDTWPELDSLIVNMLHKDPKRRPTSAAWIAEQLERIRIEQGLRWLPPDELEVPQRTRNISPPAQIATLDVDRAETLANLDEKVGP